MTELVLTEKKLRQSAQWQGWLGWFAFAPAREPRNLMVDS